MQTRVLWTGEKLLTGQANVVKSAVERQEVMNRAG
jgi:hypothetical protein